MITTAQTGIELRGGDRVELLVADSSLARALYAGIPAARLLGRARLASDERDVSHSRGGTSTTLASTWDLLLKRLLGPSPETLERVRRAVAKHTRVAVDEGPLAATDGTVAALVYAVACSQDPDASLAEIFATEGVACDAHVARICFLYDPRLSSGAAQGAPRAAAGDQHPAAIAATEACVRLAAHASIGPLPWERLRDAAEILSGPELALTLLRPFRGSLFPTASPPTAGSRRMTQLERGELDALVAKDPRELAATIARLERGPASARAGSASSATSSGGAPAYLDTLVANLARLLSHPGVLVLAIPTVDPPLEDDVPQNTRVSRPSWLPQDWSSPQSAAETFADALERGTVTVPRVRAHVASGGDAAFDAIGAEMLHIAAHPFASACFAEILARSGRPRDVIRLVTYFAVAPDPAPAARALSGCTAPELPRVLLAWLEAMLPTDGEQALLGEEDAEHSSAARLTACVAALAPYPKLYRAVRPLLSRVSDAPPPPST